MKNNDEYLTVIEDLWLKVKVAIEEIERLRQEVRGTDKIARNSIEQYKNDYDKVFEQLKAQQREIDVLKAENEKLKMYNDKLCQGIYWENGKQFSNAIELEKEHAIKEFAEKLKERLTKFIWRHEIPECIFNDIMSELLKEYEK